MRSHFAKTLLLLAVSAAVFSEPVGRTIAPA
jgi:hypothetical protein